MQDTRSTPLEEAITGAMGVLMVTVFLGFLAVDIGDVPLVIVTLIVLALVIFDFVQSVREALKASRNEPTGE